MTTRSQETPTQGALFDVKVLDMAGPIGVYCSKLLADMGADVIRVEPPSGDPMRKLGPFYKHDGNPEHSLYWWHYNTSKRGITLDIESPKGREVFKKLVRWADIFVETFEPGYLDKLGLGFTELHKINPKLIMSSVTPFGQNGPYAHFKANDIVGQAMSGQTNTVGLPGHPPYIIGSEMGYWTAGTLAADATLLALAYRDAGGEGQQVDTSLQEAMALGLVGNAQSWDILGALTRRGGLIPGRRATRSVYPCKDGWIFFIAAAPGTSMEAVRELLAEKGFGEEFDPKWLNPEVIRTDDKEGTRFEAVMERFFMHYTRRELLEMSFNREKQVFATPTDTPKEVVESPHLQARGWFQDVEYPELGTKIKHPGPIARLPESPMSIARRAPRKGEHTNEVLRKVLAMNDKDIADLRASGVI